MSDVNLSAVFITSARTVINNLEKGARQDLLNFYTQVSKISVSAFFTEEAKLHILNTLYRDPDAQSNIIDFHCRLLSALSDNDISINTLRDRVSLIMEAITSSNETIASTLSSILVNKEVYEKAKNDAILLCTFIALINIKHILRITNEES